MSVKVDGAEGKLGKLTDTARQKDPKALREEAWVYRQ